MAFLSPFGRVSGVVPPNHVQIFVSLLSPDIKKVAHSLKPSKKKIDFLDGHLGVSGGWYPQTTVCEIIFAFQIFIDSKKIARQLKAVKNNDFRGVFTVKDTSYPLIIFTVV